MTDSSARRTGYSLRATGYTFSPLKCYPRAHKMRHIDSDACSFSWLPTTFSQQDSDAPVNSEQRGRGFPTSRCLSAECSAPAGRFARRLAMKETRYARFMTKITFVGLNASRSREIRSFVRRFALNNEHTGHGLQPTRYGLYVLAPLNAILALTSLPATRHIDSDVRGSLRDRLHLAAISTAFSQQDSNASVNSEGADSRRDASRAAADEALCASCLGAESSAGVMPTELPTKCICSSNPTKDLAEFLTDTLRITYGLQRN
ncbi:hypothetical protein NM688_g9056 [Phlebia brevispora]|uniref:Uncharacterized protein n=1 Tax=Phlebia brevispora TaxID=194682 RepID=A0ACC1RJY3_9APHY|nr:hypothetical protein NM688_g9056 [Phlebia brevispora]